MKNPNSNTPCADRSFCMKNQIVKSASVIFALLSMASLDRTSAAFTLTDWTSITNSGTDASGLIGGNTSTATGSLNGIAVNYLGPLITGSTIYNIIDGTSNYFDNATFGSSYSAGPVALSDRLVTYNGAGNSHTITFAQPILNPVLYINSLGDNANGIGVFWTFSAETPTSALAASPVSILSRNSSNNLVLVDSLGNALPSISATSNVVLGVEGHGILQFSGNITKIRWVSSVFEGVTSFQVGVIPEPTSALLVVIAGSLTLLRRKRF